MKRYEGSQLKKGDVIIVDEAGMVGTENWNEILKSAEKFGAKVIAVGDSNQFEAIASGDCFRKFIEVAKSKDQLFELNEIRRQKQKWMKEASIEFSGLNTIEGLTRYENHGNIKEYENKEDVIKEAALSYIGKEKIGTTAVLCYKKNTCNEVNIEIRNLKKEEGTISSEIITTINGKEYAENDKIIFLQNDKKLNIKNGMTGIILGGNEDILKIKTEDNRDIEINTNKYDKIDYGYAITLHKSQGKTYDNVTIVAEKMMDAKATYVAMTRHRENVEMLYSKEEFSSFKMLTNEISKIKQKDLIVDYQNIQNENKTRVFEYQDSLMETSKILKDINQGQGDWKEYREIKNYSIELGKEIYKDYENHKLYLDQIGITKEKLEIRLGIKNRPLSSVEINARDRVKLYAKTSEETRYLFKTMRKETFDITKHEKYGIYTDIREIRNDLAKEILANYPLHRTFIREFSREYYISKKTMENQISYEENVLNKNIEKSDTKTQGSIYSINAINEIKNIIDQNKNERLLKFDLIEVLRGNLKSDFKLKEVLDDEGLGNYISKCTTSAFMLVCGIGANEERGNSITKYANAILENGQKDKEYNEQLNSFTVKTVLKQAACFDALIEANNGRKLTKEEVNELFMKAQVISNQLNEKEIHLLNNEKVIKDLNEVKIGKTNLIENESIKNISDRLYQIINPDLQKDKNGQCVYENESYKNYITTRYTDEYQRHYCIGRKIKITDSGLEYANMVLNKNLSKDGSLTNLMRDAIKQAICFEVIRKDANMNKDGLQEIHKKAEILASQIEHKDLSYENKYKFENMKKEVYENTHDLPKEKELNDRELGKLSEIIQNEKALETQKQHELQLQQSLQKLLYLQFHYLL